MKNHQARRLSKLLSSAGNDTMSVFKRLQQIGKKAAKFEFNISFQDLAVECKKQKWFPHKLGVNWTRRNRNIRTKPFTWNPDLDNPCLGHVDWKIPENVKSNVTLFRDPRATELEDKEWVFNIEKYDRSGRRKVIATEKINMKDYASLSPVPREVTVNIKPLSEKYSNIVLTFTISCSLIKEGNATDDDMQSLASLMSIDREDVGDLGDFGEDDSSHPTTLSVTTDSTASEFQNLASDIDQLTKRGSISPLDGLLDPANRPPPRRGEGHSPFEHGLLSLSSSHPFEELSPAHSLSFLASTPVEGGRRSPALRPTALPGILDSQLSAASRVSPPIGESSPLVTGSPTSLSPGGISGKTSAMTDLLTWAKDVTRGYRGVKVTNFTTSWRNGMAFCSVIHCFRPDLIEFDALIHTDIKENNRIAYEAAATVGVKRLLDPHDMVFLKIPDKLMVMAYVHQLRDAFTGSQGATAEPDQVQLLPVTSPGASTKDTSTEDLLSKNLFGETIPQKLTSAEDDSSTKRRNAAGREVYVKDVLASSQPDQREVCERRISEGTRRPTKPPLSVPNSRPASGELADVASKVSRMGSQRKSTNPFLEDDEPGPILVVNSQKVKAVTLMTRKQLLNPFDSDDEDEVDPYAYLQDGAKENKEVPVSGENVATAPPGGKGDDMQEDSSDRRGVAHGVEPQDSQRGDSADQRHDSQSKRSNLKERAQKLLEKAKRDAAERNQLITDTAAATTPGSQRKDVQKTARQLLAKFQAEHAQKREQTSPKYEVKQFSAYQFNPKEVDDEIAEINRSKLTTPISPPFSSTTLPAAPSLTSSSHEISPDSAWHRISALSDNQASLSASFRYDLSSRDGDSYSTAANASDAIPAAANTDLLPALRPGGGSSGNGIPASSSVNAKLNKLMASPPVLAAALAQTDAERRKMHGSLSKTGVEWDGTYRCESQENILNPSEYVNELLGDLKKEEELLSAQGYKTEVECRRAMDEGDQEKTDRLTEQFLSFINQKNTLTRRQDELRMIESQHDLEKRCELLGRELRKLDLVDESEQDTAHQRHYELLMVDLVSIINQRDALVQATEDHYRMMDDDEAAEKAVKSAKGRTADRSCIVQ